MRSAAAGNGARAASASASIRTETVAPIRLGQADTPLQQAIGFFAVALGAANAAGGYVVTERMLGMFKKKED